MNKHEKNIKELKTKLCSALAKKLKAKCEEEIKNADIEIIDINAKLREEIKRKHVEKYFSKIKDRKSERALRK